MNIGRCIGEVVAGKGSEGVGAEVVDATDMDLFPGRFCGRVFEVDCRDQGVGFGGEFEVFAVLWVLVIELRSCVEAEVAVKHTSRMSSSTIGSSMDMLMSMSMSMESSIVGGMVRAISGVDCALVLLLICFSVEMVCKLMVSWVQMAGEVR